MNFKKLHKIIKDSSIDDENKNSALLFIKEIIEEEDRKVEEFRTHNRILEIVDYLFPLYQKGSRHPTVGWWNGAKLLDWNYIDNDLIELGLESYVGGNEYEQETIQIPKSWIYLDEEKYKSVIDNWFAEEKRLEREKEELEKANQMLKLQEKEKLEYERLKKNLVLCK